MSRQVASASACRRGQPGPRGRAVRAATGAVPLLHLELERARLRIDRLDRAREHDAPAVQEPRAEHERGRLAARRVEHDAVDDTDTRPVNGRRTPRHSRASTRARCCPGRTHTPPQSVLTATPRRETSGRSRACSPGRPPRFSSRPRACGGWRSRGGARCARRGRAGRRSRSCEAPPSSSCRTSISRVVRFEGFSRVVRRGPRGSPRTPVRRRRAGRCRRTEPMQLVERVALRVLVAGRRRARARPRTGSRVSAQRAAAAA